MDDYVYLLTTTVQRGSHFPHGCAFVVDDPGVIAPTSKMGFAMAFDSEIEAREFKSNNNLPFEITPIARKRYFQSKLDGT